MSKTISRIESKIENSFSHAFWNKFPITLGTMPASARNVSEIHSKIITACAIMHNLHIRLENKTFVDGPSFLY